MPAESRPGTATPTIAIVMPAYNEAERIEETLEAIAAYARRTAAALPLFLADDGSADRTTGVAWAAAERLGLELTILRLPHRGKALTVRDAMIAVSGQASAQFLLMLDADNEISVDQLANVDWTDDPRTIYIARRVAGARGEVRVRPRPFRRLMSLGMRLAARILLGLPFPDTQCGFKLFPRSLAFELFSQQRADSWVFDAELLVIARVAGIRIREVPVTWKPRGVSRVGSTAALSSAVGLLGIAFRRWTGQYRRVGPPVP